MMETINWTADMETCLFYAMMDHKPVGNSILIMKYYYCFKLTNFIILR